MLNRSGSSVTEVSVPTGKLVRVISGPAYRSDALTAVAAAGPELFVAGGLGTLGPGHCFVKDVHISTGLLAGAITGSPHDFVDPEAMLTMGADLLVLDSGANAVTELRT